MSFRNVNFIEVDKASCGSPTIITSSEPCPMEKDDQEQARGSDVTNKSANDIQPSPEDPKRDDAEGDDTGFTFKVTALPDTSQRESGKCWSPVPVGEKCNSSVVSLHIFLIAVTMCNWLWEKDNNSKSLLCRMHILHRC